MIGRRRERPPVERVDGGFAVTIGRDEREVLVRLLGELRSLLIDDSAPEVLTRIFPPAYHLPADAEANADYWRLMREELVASRLTAISTVEAALEGGDLLDDAQLMALMQSINGVRLVLGTILDVDEETDLGDIDDDDPRLAEHHLYGFLSWLLDWTLRALDPA